MQTFLTRENNQQTQTFPKDTPDLARNFIDIRKHKSELHIIYHKEAKSQNLCTTWNEVIITHDDTVSNELFLQYLWNL